VQRELPRCRRRLSSDDSHREFRFGLTQASGATHHRAPGKRDVCRTPLIPIRHTAPCGMLCGTRREYQIAVPSESIIGARRSAEAPALNEERALEWTVSDYLSVVVEPSDEFSPQRGAMALSSAASRCGRDPVGRISFGPAGYADTCMSICASS